VGWSEGGLVGGGQNVGRCGKTNHYKAKLGKTWQNQAKPSITRNPRLSGPLFNTSYSSKYIYRNCHIKKAGGRGVTCYGWLCSVVVGCVWLWLVVVGYVWWSCVVVRKKG
jgi:hypothetical protein